MVSLLIMILFCSVYQAHVETFCQHSSKLNQSNHSLLGNTSIRSDKPSPKPVKIDKMKHTHRLTENDENSQPAIVQAPKTTEKKKSTLHRYRNVVFFALRMFDIRPSSFQCIEFLSALAIRTVCRGTHRSRSFNPSVVSHQPFLGIIPLFVNLLDEKERVKITLLLLRFGLNMQQTTAHRTSFLEQRIKWNDISPMVNLALAR